MDQTVNVRVIIQGNYMEAANRTSWYSTLTVFSALTLVCDLCGYHSSSITGRDYSALRGLGFPLPALATMQEIGVTLSDACWDVRKSLTGFSVSFFWPATTTSKVGVAQGHSAKSKKRRRRRKRKRGRAKDSTKYAPAAKPVAKRVDVSPVGAHHDPEFDDATTSSVSNSECVEEVIDSDSVGIGESAVGVEDSDPERTLVETSLDAANIDLSADVYYCEVNDRPGLCVERPNEPLNWSPVKFSRRSVKAASATSSDSEIDVTECLCIDYQRRNNEPGVEIETKDNTFWIPVAHQTRSRFRPET